MMENGFSPPVMKKNLFSPINEADVSREMTSRYFADMQEYAESDVVIVGAGPAGLTASYYLGKKGVKVALVEASIAPGGGAWVSGQLMSAMVVRKPAHTVLDELGIEYEEKDSYVVLRHAGLFTATILSTVLAMKNVKLFNGVAVEDLITKEGRVSGVVTNWMPVTKIHGTQSCMDPNVMRSRVVISSCGHDGPFGATGVKRLRDVGMVSHCPGMKTLDMSTAEDEVVEHTKEIVPGMIVTGMEVAEAYGCHRMGPTFGAMLLSGKKAATIALAQLQEEENDIASKISEAFDQQGNTAVL
jgi:thiamine thiazole synthase